MVDTNVSRAGRLEKTPDSLHVTFRHIANGEERNRAVGRRLLAAAVGEQRIAGKQPGDEMSHDRPADDLHDETGGPFRTDSLGKQPAEGGAGDRAGNAPQHDRDQYPPDEAAFM